MSRNPQQAVHAHKCGQRDLKTSAALQEPGRVFAKASKCYHYGSDRGTCKGSHSGLARDRLFHSTPSLPLSRPLSPEICLPQTTSNPDASHKDPQNCERSKRVKHTESQRTFR